MSQQIEPCSGPIQDPSNDAELPARDPERAVEAAGKDNRALDK